MKLSMLLLQAALCASALPLHAQQAAVSYGDRVRVATAARPPMRGTVVRVDTAGLAIRTEAADTVFTPWRQVQRVDLSRGRSPGRSGLTVGAFGLALGAVGGAALGHYTFEDPPVPEECIAFCTRRQNTVISAVVLGVIGARAGFVLGSRFPPERWGRAPLPVRITVAPGAGVRLGARIGF